MHTCTLAHSDQEWATTLDTLTKVKLPRDTEAVASDTTSPTDSVASRNTPRVSAAHLVSPGKPIVMLGAMLTAEGRLDEIVETYIKAHFYEIFEMNMQIFDKQPLKPKMDEKVTDICVRIAAVKWGILNWDKLFCNCLAMVLRGFGFKLPRRGKTPSYMRDWATMLRDKASSIRNKLFLYKTTFICAPDDNSWALQRLACHGLKVSRLASLACTPRITRMHASHHSHARLASLACTPRILAGDDRRVSRGDVLGRTYPGPHGKAQGPRGALSRDEED